MAAHWLRRLGRVVLDVSYDTSARDARAPACHWTTLGNLTLDARKGNRESGWPEASGSTPPLGKLDNPLTSVQSEWDVVVGVGAEVGVARVVGGDRGGHVLGGALAGGAAA